MCHCRLFDDPDKEERVLYVQYWQRKLKSNDKVDFPESLVKEIAAQTDGFSLYVNPRHSPF